MKTSTEKRNKPVGDSIFEGEKKAKASAQDVLIIAKKLEKKKLSQGYSFVQLDPKTLVLRKPF
jgi:hypothetical protein